ncbi:MAG: fibrobacter succinogenes major paralogous domain-containing protein [Bacteroidia bacterium]|nr:fibrobacter succinogenes major paralogous domain-containing protein [Bacteroidia bacterium]
MKQIYLFLFLALTITIGHTQSNNQVINLPQGWSMFSTYIQLSPAAISTVMFPVVSQVTLVKNGAGNVYWPQYGVNSIGNMQIGEGYQVNMLTAQNLTITGAQLVPENTPFVIPQGWSMIGYLRIFSSRIDSAFSDILNNVIIVKDDQGNVYWPGQGVNQTIFIKPGKGYQIKMLNADTMTYASDIFHCGIDALTDYDGNTYNTVQIGSQCWIKENLATTHYSDGTSLVDGTNAITGDYTTKYWFVYDNNPSNKAIYGLLYTWAAVMNGSTSSNSNPSGIQGVCPTGWHVPGEAEWTQLTNFFGGGSIAGGKLKEAGINHWVSPNTGATNESGFTALPGGYRDLNGTFYYVGDYGYWWSSTEYDATSAWNRYLLYNSSGVDGYYGSSKASGFSVRCLRDNFTQVSLPSVTTSNITDITQTNATGGGEITNDGGATITVRGVCWNNTGDPTTSDSHTTGGTGTGIFTSSITGLSANTLYFVRAYATNSAGTAYGSNMQFTTPATAFTCGTSTITDYDANIYNTVQIGNQCWIKENMATTHYSDGTSLVDGTSAGNIYGNYTTKYWFVYNNSISNKATYGLLYTWAAVMNGAASSSANPSGVQGVCPTGWHVPSDAEWKQMEMFLGMSQSQADATGYRGTTEGGKLKETGTTHWNSPNTEATNSSDFTALPGGIRGGDGTFANLGGFGYWWSATEVAAPNSWYRYLSYANAQVGRNYVNKSDGFSIRCTRDY